MPSISKVSVSQIHCTYTIAYTLYIRTSSLKLRSIINPSVKQVSCRRVGTVREILGLLIFGGCTHEIASAERSGDRNAWLCMA